jgi:hypothetical protein
MVPICLASVPESASQAEIVGRVFLVARYHGIRDSQKGLVDIAPGSFALARDVAANFLKSINYIGAMVYE